MNAAQAREAIKSLGEFAGSVRYGDGSTLCSFVKYDPGARDGKFHKYKTFSMPNAVFEEIKSELK